MDTNIIGRVKLPPVEQIGIVVKDMDLAIDYYYSIFGWGPFRAHVFELKGTMSILEYRLKDHQD